MHDMKYVKYPSQRNFTGICILLGPPALESFDPAYYLIAGHLFTLNCSATNDVTSPKNLTFIWYKGNNLITEPIRVVSSTTSQLHIPQLDPDQHSGKYSCEVYNNHLSDSVYTSTSLIIEG